jgi:hypothetical protein
MPAVDLSAAAARQRANGNGQPPQPEPDAEPEVIPVDTAFLVYRRIDNGQIVMTHDINVAIQPQRGPNHDDVYMMMQVIIKDMLAAQIAGLSVQGQLQAQQQMAQQMMSPAEQAAMAGVMNRRPG